MFWRSLEQGDLFDKTTSTDLCLIIHLSQIQPYKDMADHLIRRVSQEDAISGRTAKVAESVYST